jgi:hypothetical protein
MGLMTHQDRLVELGNNLATTGANVLAADIDDQARGAMLSLVEVALKVRSFPIKFESRNGECPNCGSPVISRRTPYCSEVCRCEAAFIRQFRAGLQHGSILERDRQVAFGENMWRILGGLYPRRQAMVLDRVLKRVMKRTDGMCESCGAAASTVDHIGSG